MQICKYVGLKTDEFIETNITIDCHLIYTVSRKKQATLIFNVTSPSVEMFLQFLQHIVQD